MPTHTDDRREPMAPTQVAGDTHSIREVVGLFDDYAALEQAVDALLVSGFARCELSLLADGGTAPGRASEELADDPAATRTDHFCTEALGNAEGSLIGGFAILPAFGGAWAAAAAGTTTLAATGVALGTGGVGAVLGAALAVLLARRRAAHHAGQTAEGGQLLWVRTRSPELERRALDVLARHSAHHVHAHDLPT